jgi:hypothetical protein
MFRPYEHTHPRNPVEVVYGQRLEAYDVIQADDVYADMSGIWRQCGIGLHGQAAGGLMYVVRLIERLAPTG